jgi:HicB family
MQLDAYVEALREDLGRVAAVGDESTARAADLLAMALEASFGRRLQEALSEAALELSGQLDRGTVEVRIAGSDPELIYVPGSDVPADQSVAEESSARISLRLPESLKSRVESAAAISGISVNSWLVQALNRALEPRTTAGGGGRRRLTGYGRS